jgi:predicted transcriptional regulator YdeE
MEIINTHADITVHGISTRTNNALEMSSEGKIPQLWADFDKHVDVNYMAGNRVFGVYDNYASDANGDFDVTAATNQENVPTQVELISKTIKAGKYLVFTEKGEMPQIAIDAWNEVWAYFTSDECEYERCYGVDYEYYVSGGEVRVFIGVV